MRYRIIAPASNGSVQDYPYGLLKFKPESVIVEDSNPKQHKESAMKQFKLLSIVIALILVFAAFGPASAQLGTTDSSYIKIQNVSGGSVQVTVQFVSTTGTTYTPNPLSNSPAIANPFTLANNASIMIDVSTVPSLPSGSYSVVISSTGKVVATASVFGQSTSQFSAAYPSFSGGATTIFIPTAAYNYFGWFSMISVMNIGSAPTDVQVTINCANSGSVGLSGTLSKTGLAPNASVTWALKNTIPTGFNAGTVCQGGATIVSTNTPQPLVAVNNQNKPAQGATNSMESTTSGYPTIYVPQLSSNYFGFVSALNILKQTAGNTTVTVTFGDGAPSTSCNLTDAIPSCQLLMTNVHPQGTRFGATLTTNPSKPLLVSVGSTHTTGLSGGYIGFGSGSPAVAIPLALKSWFNWTTAINCMNVSATPTTINIAYEGYPAYNYPTTLNQGGSAQITLATDANLPASNWNGSVVVTANAAGAQIACMIGSSLGAGVTPPLPGDWTMQYNALVK
jgi:hypothetical protein